MTITQSISSIILIISLLSGESLAFQPRQFANSQFHQQTSRSRSTTALGPTSFGWTGKPDRFISNIFEANKRWKYGKLAEDHEFFDKLGSGHAPKYLWIGCADARVPANEIMGEDAGTVFVLRNVANMVVNTDFNLMSGLQYAVSVLKVPHIIVCGHYDCGGVRASMMRKDHGPPLENWLRNIRDVYRLHRTELDSISDPEQRHRRLVELNVIEQCINLFKTGVVQRQRVETFQERSKPQTDPKALDYTTPRIHACVFDPKTGDMNRLQVDFREYIEELHTIYDLYTLDEPEVVKEKPHAPRPIHEFDHKQNSMDPNDIIGAGGEMNGARSEYVNGSRDPNDVYRMNNRAMNRNNDPNDIYPTNAFLYRVRETSDNYKTPVAPNGARPQAYNNGRNGARAYDNADGPRGKSYSATDGAAYPNGAYDPYRATDGAIVPADAYGTIERADLNEIYRPPARATDAPYDVEYDPSYDSYGAAEDLGPLNEPYSGGGRGGGSGGRFGF